MKSERLDEFDASRNHDRGKRVHIGEEKTRDIIVTTPSPKPAIPHKLRQMVEFFQIHGQTFIVCVVLCPFNQESCMYIPL